jgi:hypothetical protein
LQAAVACAVADEVQPQDLALALVDLVEWAGSTASADGSEDGLGARRRDHFDGDREVLRRAALIAAERGAATRVTDELLTSAIDELTEGSDQLTGTILGSGRLAADQD